jgi:hypothetical protein
MRAGSLFSRVVLWTLVAAIGVPPAPATAAGPPGNWLRVTALRPDTRIVVTLDDEETVDGWFVSAGPRGLVVHLIRDDVAIPRDRVVQVAIVKDGRPWYTIPVVAAAVAGGVAITAGVLWLIGTHSWWYPDDDSDWGFLAVFAMPVLSGIWAYRRIEGKLSLKVIYKAPRPVRLPADR